MLSKSSKHPVRSQPSPFKILGWENFEHVWALEICSGKEGRLGGKAKKVALNKVQFAM